ncbi:unnamed protein product [Phytomonas sp. EM1]|nr:unnamed protein product [Phytomonas sp. EM1]|eukprot:CCW59613.1 unnamed protein product [Phytomonas sp. isolate EM1]
MDQNIVSNPIFFILGSTGTGKSSFAVELAKFLKDTNLYENVVIINCDVMQFYQDLPIATNKISSDEMKNIPHAFLGFLDCHDFYLFDPVEAFFNSESTHSLIPQSSTNSRFDIRCYVDKVTEFINRYFAVYSNSAIIICGGTCYYAQSILFNNTLVSEDDDKVSTSHSNDDGAEGELWDVLNRIDPQIASRYHPNDKRRLRRLIAIHRKTKKLPSEIYSSKNVELRFPKERTFVLCLWLPRDQLYESLNARVDAMISKGLLSEVMEFQKRNEGNNRQTSIMETIGLKEFRDLFIHGDVLNEEFQGLVQSGIDQVKSNTRRYARQQERWLLNRFQTLLVYLKDDFISHHFMKIDSSQIKHSEDIVALVHALFAGKAEKLFFSDCLHNITIEPKRPVSQEVCNICNTVVYGRGQMELHILSKHHRSAVKRRNIEIKFKEMFGKDLPPPKRRKI